MRFDDSQLAFIKNEDYPYVCVANAGAGKSTSLLGKAHKLALDPGRNGKILILCFNRGIQEEMQEKIQAKGLSSLGVEVKTLHALGRQFVEQAVNVARKPLNCIPSTRNSHLYYGFIRKEDRTRYGKYPGLINKILEELDAKSMNKALDVDLTTEINMLGLRVLTEECPHYAPTDLAPEESKHYPKILALVSTLLRSIKKTSPSNVKLYAERISYDYIANVDLRRKPVDFWKFFTKRFYRNGFTNFVHACALEFIFKKDLYGRFAQDDIDNAPKVFPMFYAYCKELTPVNTYKRYSDLLEDNLAALIISDLVMQVNQWGELDFDSMLTLGAYSLLKIKGGNYHAILVDECQDLSLLYWYLVYEAYPKYLIHDKEKRLYFVGDRQQCWEENEEIATSSGIKTAREITVGDLVKSFSHGKVLFTPVTSQHIFQDSFLLQVTTDGGKSIRVSRNHLFLANTSNINREGKTYHVYIMYRPDLGYRIGVTKNSRARMNIEGATRLWILESCFFLNEALLKEKIYSLRYRLPTIVFNFRGEGLPQESLNELFKQYGNDHEGVVAVFKDFNLDFNSPTYNGAKTRTTTSRSFLKIGLFRVKESFGNSPFVVILDTQHEALKHHATSKYFKNYKKARLYAEDLFSHVKDECPDADVFLEENMNISDELKHFRLVKATDLYPGYKLPVINVDGVLGAETIVKVDKIEGEFSFSSIEVAETGVVFSQNGILTHNSINRWNYACPERFVTMANRHSRGQLVYTYRCPQAIVDKAQALKEVSVCARIDLEEDKFISAAPPEQQPGEYSHIEAIDATRIDAFFKEKGYRYEDAVILGRTNNDLLAWQMWLLITQVPCRELLVNKLELTSDKAKTLLALVAIADPSPDTPEIALEWLRNTKGEAATEYFLQQTYTASGDDLDAAILKFFTSLNMKDEEDLSEEEMQELNMGRGAISVLREWYAKNSFNLKDKLKSFIESVNFTLNMRPEGISLSTIHRYKGREKDIVLIQSNSWGAICKNAQDNMHQLNEELCLLYVSITRARRAVHIVKGNMHPLA